MPRSVLLGRVVEPGEPLWRRDDTEAVLEYLADQAMRCKGCGLPKAETMDRDADGRYVSRAFRCHACAARDREAQRFAKSPDHNLAGLQFTVEERRD